MSRPLTEITSLTSRFCRAQDCGPEAGAALRELREAVASATQPRHRVEAAIRRGVSRRYAEAGAVVEAAFTVRP